MADQNEKGLESLLVWHKSIDFAIHVSKGVLPLLPSTEKFALESQLRRSVQSIPANIAEGYGRYYYQDSIRFCYIARGSIEESYSHLILVCKLGYLPDELFHELSIKTQELRKLLNGYIAFLKRSKRGDNEPGNYHVRESSNVEDFNQAADDDQSIYDHISIPNSTNLEGLV